MKWRWIVTSALLVVMLLALTVGSSTAQGPGTEEGTSPQAAVGTAFTYQGHLFDGADPADGLYDFRFILYDAEAGGSQVGSTLTLEDVAVSGGLFTVALDFGPVFDGTALWLEVAVRPGSSTGTYTVLSPRQPLTATPYATYAATAPWDGLIGIPAGFADAVDNDTTYTAGTGLELTGTQFGLAATYRLPQGCNSGQIAKWDGVVWTCAEDEIGSTDYWSLSGNAGLDPALHFLGTTDAITLTLKVSGTTALRLAPTAGLPNFIGGDEHNDVAGGVTGATIGGGGPSDPADPAGTSNRVYDNYGTIGGGGNNRVGSDDDDPTTALYATVGGGNSNTASGRYATVGGGDNNTASGYYATVGGGDNNTASSYHATVGGGGYNTASSSDATIGGGHGNTVSDWYATVSGGLGNIASGGYAAVSGGEYNTADGEASAVGGGYNNAALGGYAAVGGGLGNTASGGYAVVGGGLINTVSGGYAVIGGGYQNTAEGDYATIAGGGPSNLTDPANTNNRVYDNYGTIGGGGNNRVGSDDDDPTTAAYATVGGGRSNTASSWAATVGGGDYNTASGMDAAIGGGASNTASGVDATIGGGYFNTASGGGATIAGGEGNTASSDYAAIGGGYYNTASDWAATVGGGESNTASDSGATVGGGASNTASGSGATVGGGTFNTASGYAATIPGGYGNLAQGNYSFAAGRNAKAYNQGCFVWGDATAANLSCSVDNRWVARASGGVYFYTSGDLSTGAYLSAGGGAWNSLSSRRAKENFRPVDTQRLLERLAALEITTWNYKSQDDSIRHIGPMAEDFNALLEDLGGEGYDHINSLDADGVALAAIQALYRQNQALQAENEALRTRLDDLEARMDDLLARLAELEQQVAGEGGEP